MHRLNNLVYCTHVHHLI